jgi:hypothetical protein
MGGNALETSQQYDTFGFTAAEYARKQASKEQKERLASLIQFYQLRKYINQLNLAYLFLPLHFIIIF